MQVDRLVRVIAKPTETEPTLDALLATTFVTRVDRATLSVIAPLLSKCLKSRQSNMHRKAGMVSDASGIFCDNFPIDGTPIHAPRILIRVHVHAVGHSYARLLRIVVTREFECTLSSLATSGRFIQYTFLKILCLLIFYHYDCGENLTMCVGE